MYILVPSRAPVTRYFRGLKNVIAVISLSCKSFFWDTSLPSNTLYTWNDPK